MRYQKPAVVDLSLNSKSAAGVMPSCFSGSGATTGGGDCQYGTGPQHANGNKCNTGPQPGGSDPEACYSGPTAGAYCQNGSAPIKFWGTCTDGPNPE